MYYLFLSHCFLFVFLSPGHSCCLQWEKRCFFVPWNETFSGHPDVHPHFRAHLLLRLAPPSRRPQQRHAPVFGHHQRDLQAEKVHSCNVNDESAHLLCRRIYSSGAHQSDSSTWKKIFRHWWSWAVCQHFQVNRIFLPVHGPSLFLPGI